MFSLLTFLFQALFSLFKSKKDLIVQICLQKKEIEILHRQNQKKRLKIQHSDRIIFSLLSKVGHIKDTISIVKPETLCKWQRQLIKHFWTFKCDNRIGEIILTSHLLQVKKIHF